MISTTLHKIECSFNKIERAFAAFESIGNGAWTAVSVPEPRHRLSMLHRLQLSMALQRRISIPALLAMIPKRENYVRLFISNEHSNFVLKVCANTTSSVGDVSTMP